MDDLKKNELPVNEETVASYPTNFSISWHGKIAPENSATIEYPNYHGKILNIGMLITGTPAWGSVGAVTATPINCELKSGQKQAVFMIQAANFNTTSLFPVTPKSEYKGKTVKFSINVVGHEDAVLFVKGEIGP